MITIERLFTYLLLFTVCTIGYGQNSTSERSNDQAMKSGIKLGEALYTSKPFVKQLEGSPYLLDEWMKAVLRLKSISKPFSTEKLKYDVANMFFDMLISDEIKSINGIHVSGFDLIDQNENVRQFESCKQFKFDGVALTGFFEILYEGDLKLFERSYVYIKPATYNKALMIGEKNDKMIVKKEYYYADKTGNVTLIKKTKNLIVLGGENHKKQKIDISRGDLIRYFKENNF